MKIIKGTEAIPVDHPVFMIFGQPGIGKSSLGYSAKDPLTLDFDHGAHRAANRKDTMVINKWADIEELTADVLASYSSIVVDTVGRCLDMLAVRIIEDNPKMSQGDGSLALKGWGALGVRFRGWLNLLKSHGKDVILLAHHKEEKDGDSLIVRPDITGQSYGEVMKSSDFVGYCYMNGRKRLLDFNPTDRWVGKNPANWNPLEVPPISKAQNFIGTLIDDGRMALGKVSEDSSKILQQVIDWRAAIETYTTTEEINKTIPKCADMSPVLAPQIKTLLMQRAKALNFDWDSKSKSFVEKVSA